MFCHRLADVVTDSFRIIMEPIFLRFCAKTKSSIISISGKPPAARKVVRRVNIAWSPYGRLKQCDRRFANQAIIASLLLLLSIFSENAPAETFGCSRVFTMSRIKFSGSRVSAWRKSRISPDAAFAPMFICLPRPCGAESVRQFAFSASKRVLSVLPPSTRITSHSEVPCSDSSSRGRAYSSLSVGMTIEISSFIITTFYLQKQYLEGSQYPVEFRAVCR